MIEYIINYVFARLKQKIINNKNRIILFSLLLVTLTIISGFSVYYFENGDKPAFHNEVTTQDDIDDHEDFEHSQIDLTNIPENKRIPKKFDIESSDSFFLEGDALSDIIMKVYKSDGSETEYIQITKNNDNFEEELSNYEERIEISQLYYYPEGVESIEVYNYSDNLKVNTPKQAPTQKDIDIRGAAQVSIDYKERFFESLGIDVVLREEWGAPNDSYWTPWISDTNKFIVHHTVTNVNMDDPASSVLAIYNYHYYRCSNNIGSFDPNREDCDEPDEIWNDIGYNYLIDPYGNIYEGRAGGNGVVGAHAGPFNTGSIGIGMLGTYSNELPTPAARIALQRLIGVLGKFNDIEPIHNETVFGHRDFSATACPGQDLYDYLPYLAIYSKDKFFDSIPQINQVNELSSSLAFDQEIFNNNYTSRLFFEKSKLLPGDLSLIQSNQIRGVSDVFEIEGYVIVIVRNELVYQTIAEYNLIFPHLEIQPDYVYRTAAWDNSNPDISVPEDYDGTINWHHEITNLPGAWSDLGGCQIDNSCGGSQDVTVAILDTGVAYENYSFDAGAGYNFQYVKGMNLDIPMNPPNSIFNEGYDREFVQANQLSNTNFVGGYDSAWSLLCQIRQVDGNTCNSIEYEKINHANDDIGHGTKIASIISANTDDSSTDRIVGIAHNVSILPVKITYPNDKDFCFESYGYYDSSCSNTDMRSVASTLSILKAYEYLSTQNIDVVNLSFQGPDTDPILERVINSYTLRNDILTVVPSGNDNSGVRAPGNFEHTLTVSAVDSSQEKPLFSSFGEDVFLAAPGGDPGFGLPIYSFNCTDCSDESSSNILKTFTSDILPVTDYGTSYSAAQVTGLVALMKSKHPNLSSFLIREHIKNNVVDIGLAGKDDAFGYGLLDYESILLSIGEMRVCPDRHFEKRDKNIIDSGSNSLGIVVKPSEYYIYNNNKYYVSSFDAQWVQNNCSLEKMIVE